MSLRGLVMATIKEKLHLLVFILLGFIFGYDERKALARESSIEGKNLLQ